MPSRRGLLLLLALASCASVVHTLFASDGWPRREKVRADLELIEHENRAAEHQLAELRTELQALRTRPEVQERVVRRELGFVRDGDLVLEISGVR